MNFLYMRIIVLHILTFGPSDLYNFKELLITTQHY